MNYRMLLTVASSLIYSSWQ